MKPGQREVNRHVGVMRRAVIPHLLNIGSFDLQLLPVVAMPVGLTNPLSAPIMIRASVSMAALHLPPVVPEVNT